MSSSSALRLVGTVREVPTPIIRWRADIEGDVRTGTCDGEFLLERGGETIRITARGQDVHGDTTRVRLAWRELAERFGLALSTIPPFTEVTLELVELAPGMRVDVAGEVTEHGFAADGGPRDAPSRHVRSARAIAIGVGNDATKRVEQELAARARPTPPREPAQSVRWYEPVLGAILSMTADDVVEVAMIAIVGAVFAIAWTHAGDLQAAVGFSLGAVALFVGLHPAARIEPFYAREKRYGRAIHLDLRGRSFAFGLGLFLLVMGFGVATGALSTAPGDERHGAPVIAAFALGAIAVMVAGDIYSRSTLRRLASLGGTAAISGRLRTAKPVTLGGRPAALGRYEVWKSGWYTDSENRQKSTLRCEATHYSAVPSVVIETADGELTINTSEIAWTSTLWFRDTTRTDGGYDLVQYVPPDARVVVRGSRVDATLSAQGTEPVYLLAGPADPARWSRRVVRWRQLGRVVMIACVAGLLWASRWFG